MKIYEVIWYDAHFNDSNYTFDDIEEQTTPWIVRTVGYYAGKNRIDFRIAQEYHHSDKKYGHIMSIPHKMIISKKELV